ncbi:hypothetical protein DBB36_10665 [Flavobacterium sp. WLB]|nr:hypothetical protein AKO67_13160 [Flavobacterium sp. VMW]OWU90944.1 hypothetical protein APR43_10740 [Flavobacterium sp. NLM]PUU70009.1 hypothetical protein DBB36_10665 [Flavobacterium sp. WLB]
MGRNNWDIISFLKNLTLKRMYNTIATIIVLSDESLLFQFIKASVQIPINEPKNIQTYTLGQKLKMPSFVGNNLFQYCECWYCECVSAQMIFSDTV